MQKEDHKILAINPGSRYVGVAIFIGTELRDWAVRVLKKEKKIVDIISEYIHQYNINHFAMKEIHPSRTSKILDQAVVSMKNYVNSHVGCFYEYSIDDVKKNLLSDKRNNKKHLMEEVSLRYPFLLKEVQREEAHKNPYLIRMFEAVGIGMCCLQEIDTEERKVVRNKSLNS